MKKSIIILMIVTLVLIPGTVCAKDWNIGNSDNGSTTSVSGFGSSLNGSATAKAFQETAKCYSFSVRTDSNGNLAYSISAGPYSFSGSENSIRISKSFTFLKASGSFTLGPVPVTVGSSLGANFSYSVTNGTEASLGAAGSGDAKAGLGISGWSVGIKSVLFPLLGGTLSADFYNKKASFKLDALKLYLKLYVDYLWGVGHHDHTIADFGPLWSQTYNLW